MKYTIQMTLKQLCIQSRKWQQMYMFTWEGKLNFFFKVDWQLILTMTHLDFKKPVNWKEKNRCGSFTFVFACAWWGCPLLLRTWAWWLGQPGVAGWSQGRERVSLQPTGPVDGKLTRHAAHWLKKKKKLHNLESQVGIFLNACRP